MKVQFFVHLAIALLAVIVAGSVQAETIFVGTAFRTGSLPDGFPEFLSASEVNATTQAWNLGGATETYNSISLVGMPSNGTVGDLTISGASVSTFGGPTWSGNPDGQDTVRAAIFDPAMFNSGGSFDANIAATQGLVYQVEVLASPSGNRSMDVTVDGALFADDLFAPQGPEWSVVYRFQVTADADGIDINFGQGATGSPNPVVSAIAVTQVPEPSGFALTAIGLLGMIGLRRRFALPNEKGV